MREEVVHTDRELVQAVIQWLSLGFTPSIAITKVEKTYNKAMIFLKANQKVYPFPGVSQILCLTGMEETMGRGNFECVGYWLEDKQVFFATNCMPYPFYCANTMSKSALAADEVIGRLKISLAHRFYNTYPPKYPDLDSFPDHISFLIPEGYDVKTYLQERMDWQYISNSLAKSGKEFFLKNAVDLAAMNVFSDTEAMESLVGNRPKLIGWKMHRLGTENFNTLLGELKLSYLWDKVVKTYKPSRKATSAKKIARIMAEYKKAHKNECKDVSICYTTFTYPLFDVLYEHDDGKEYHLQSFFSCLCDANELYRDVQLFRKEGEEWIPFPVSDKEFVPGKVENIKRITKDSHVIYERDTV